jgi:hypothetical protein
MPARRPRSPVNVNIPEFLQAPLCPIFRCRPDSTGDRIPHDLVRFSAYAHLAHLGSKLGKKACMARPVHHAKESSRLRTSPRNRSRPTTSATQTGASVASHPHRHRFGRGAQESPRCRDRSLGRWFALATRQIFWGALRSGLGPGPSQFDEVQVWTQEWAGAQFYLVQRFFQHSRQVRDALEISATETADPEQLHCP